MNILNNNLFSGDSQVVASKVKKVLLTSGKHYYSLAKNREALGLEDVAIIRLESFCPFPLLELRSEISRYPNVKGERQFQFSEFV